MTELQARKLRERIAEMEREMMDFRASMTVVLTELYKTVHELESRQRWSQKPEPEAIERLKAMRDCIVWHFDDSELKTLCFDMGVNFDDLEGDAISDKARELVLYLNRVGRCDELLEYCREKRPNAKLML